MEIFELRYFLGVARFENIHRASEKLRVSPASLSKAVGRLEGELGISLFSRDGRNIRLTDHGRLLQKRASEIVLLEETARLEVGGHEGGIQVVIAGPEVLLSEMGMDLSESIRKRLQLNSFEYHAMDDEQALEHVARGEAHLAIVTSDVPAHKGLATKTLAEPSFQTYVGKGHPLFESARSKKTIAIEEILKHPFASPSRSFLGKVGLKQSVDGWRDDQFPRRVAHFTSSLKLLEELAVRGRALVYLPDYYGKRLDLAMLKISGCPYSCTQKVRLVARNPKDVGWLNQIF